MNARADLPSYRPAAEKKFLTGLARGFGGALVFGLPMLMTMEMWWLGFYMEPARLVLLLTLAMPLLIGLSHFIGFEDTFGWRDDLVDALVAYAVGFLTVTPVLLMFAVIDWHMAAHEIVGKAALQAVPASIGALLAQSQFGDNRTKERKEKRADTYGGEMFFMAVGALFLSLNVAPTEEMILISYMMTPLHALVLAIASLLLMHVFVYSVGFSGQPAVPPRVNRASLVLRYAVPGYALCLLISVYILWTFGRTAGLAPHDVVMATVVLAFPASIGAAAARLIL